MSKVKMSKDKDRNILSDQDVKPVARQTYTVAEAARMLGICRALAYRKGVLPKVRVAGRWVVPKLALERMLSETENRQ